MCYYVTSRLSQAEIYGLEHDFVVKWEEEETAPYYVAAGFAYPKLPVITSEQRFRLLRWGLIPGWQKDWENASKFRMQTLNAVSETVDGKPSFRGAIRAGRTCIVPVNGYFEWHHGEREKYPHFIFPRQDKVFLLAGVFEQWTNPDSGEFLETFSVLTTQANERMAWIHNSKKRMPAILTFEEARLWLDTKVAFKEKKHILKPFDQGMMADHTISRLITSRKENPNSPAVMEPFVYPELTGMSGENEKHGQLFS